MKKFKFILLEILRFLGAILLLMIFTFVVDYIGLYLFKLLAKFLETLSIIKWDMVYQIQWSNIFSNLLSFEKIFMILLILFGIVSGFAVIWLILTIIFCFVAIIVAQSILLVKNKQIAIFMYLYLLIKTGHIFYTIFIRQIQNIVIYLNNMALYYTGAIIIFVLILLCYGAYSVCLYYTFFHKEKKKIKVTISKTGGFYINNYNRYDDIYN